MTPREKLRDSLRSTVLQVSAINRELQEMDKELAQLQAKRAAKANALVKAIGARDALAELWLPAGVTLNCAWHNNLEGLKDDRERSGT